jgi:hypothetical protein
MILVKVTQDDIDKALDIYRKALIRGHYRRSNYCPIALALKRLRPGTPIAVGTYYCDFDNIIYELPYVAQEAVANFDAGRKIAPFAFNLFNDTRPIPVS